jgi:antibiotic biosynthesis monooxygenase (ABM) superfamily enzyme
MFKRLIWSLAAVVCLLAPTIVKAQGDYLDETIVKIKPDKVAEFTAVVKKISDANRKFNGDRWIGMETLYGEGDTYVFVSVRKDYSDIDKGNDAFNAALEKAYGKEGAAKLQRDEANCFESSRSELRRRRWDLSSKAPSDAAAEAKLVGESKVLRTIAVHVRSGHAAEFEGLLKEIKEAGEKNPDMQPFLVSQVIEGTKGTTFYVTSLRSSLAGFDKNPTLHDILGDEGFKKFQKANAESVSGTESAILHFLPELSSPPEAIAQASADFWQPKQTMMAAHKPKAAGTAAQAEVKPAAEKPKP